MPLVHAFDPPERFVAGTVGAPGHRTFFLQARDGARVTSVALEKQQVEALAERVDELLDEVMQAAGGSAARARRWRPSTSSTTSPLEQPIEEEFRAGTMTLSWDSVDRADRDRGLPVHRGGRRLARSRSTRTSRSPSPTRSSWSGSRPVRPGRSSARPQVIGAGRPDCPFCGNPIDPDGHLCVRANGFRRRDPQPDPS